MHMRTASKRAVKDIAGDGIRLSERRVESAGRNRSLFPLAALLFSFAGAAFSQSLAITSPTAAQNISGISFPLTVSLTSPASVTSVEYLVDGESQGIVRSAPWSIPTWNTNDRYRGPAHTIWAIARNSLGTTLATSPTVTFAITNDYLEPAAYINLNSVTPSTAYSSTWAGTVSIAAVIGGTNAANQKIMRVFVDGDFSGYTVLSGSTATTQIAALNTTIYPDGLHEVCTELIDTNGTAPTNGGFPFGEDCHQVTFANTSTILLVNRAASSSASTGITSFRVPASGSMTTAAGVFVLACFGDFGAATITASSVADGSLTALTPGTNGSYRIACFYKANSAGSASNVYTFSISNGVQAATALVREYSGVATSSPIDVNAITTGTSPATCPCVLSSNTFNTTTANEMIASWYYPNTNGGTFLPGSNSTLDYPSPSGWVAGPNVVGNADGTSQEVSTTQTGAAATIGSINANNMPFLMSVISFKAASSTLVSTPAELLVNPSDWVIGLSGTQQLVPVLSNTDGTTTAVTSGMNPVYSTTAASAICTVSPAGLVAGGGSYGICPITVTVGSGLSETINGWVSSSNVIPYFGTDGLVHSTGGTPVWFASVFHSTGPAAFNDVNKTNLQFATAYKLPGYNVLEGSLTDSSYFNSAQSTFQAATSTFVANQSNLLNTYGLYYHGSAGGLVTGSPDQFYNGLHRDPTGTPDWQFLGAQWFATGKFMGATLLDETDSSYTCPRMNPLMGGDITQIVGNGTTLTLTYVHMCRIIEGGATIGIFGATTNSAINSTPGVSGTATLYTVQSDNGAGTMILNQPNGGGSFTANATTDPSLRIEPLIGNFGWQAGGGYSTYTDFSTISALFQAGGGIIAGSPKAIAGKNSQCGWGGVCSVAGSPPFSQFGEIYNQPSLVGTAQYVSLSTIRTSGNNIFPNGRTFMNNYGAFRAFLGQTTGTNLNYGLNGQTITGLTAAGATITFPFPICGTGVGANNICNVTPYVSRITGSGSPNAYFNTNAYIDTCPTATTCTISLALPSTPAPVNSNNVGTVTFANGNTISPVCLEWGAGNQAMFLLGSSAGSCHNLTPVQQLNVGATFTVSGAIGANAAYWNSTTFILSGAPIPYNLQNPVGTIREVPPISQTSGPFTGQVVANDNYVRGQGQSVFAEIANGPRVPFATVMAQAILGASGHRLYQLGVDYAAQSAQGTAGQRGFGQVPCNNAGTVNCIQAGANPFYAQGADLVRTFNSPTNANLVLQRLASTGYLYAPRGPAPDIGYNIESSLRQGAKGNLLLTANFQDGSQSHAVDLTACNVPGQKKVRYTLDWRSMSITELAAGTVSDTPTWPAGGAVIYLCPNNESAEYSPPLIGSLISDAPGATKMIIRYAYAPYLLNESTSNVFDCGTGLCVLPVDRNIGPLYYRLQYVNNNGVVVATSDVQIL